nr:hypothetical protein [Tanacetum cinerariifolium]
LSEVINECCDENVNGKKIVSDGLTTRDTNSVEKGDEKSDRKHDETGDGKSDELVHFDGKREDLELLDENGEGFELLENLRVMEKKLSGRAKDDSMSGYELFLAEANLFVDDVEALSGNRKVCVRDTTNRPDDVIGSSLLRPRRFSRYLSVELVMWNWRKKKKPSGRNCKFKRRKLNFDVWKWPVRKKDGIQSGKKLLFCWESASFASMGVFPQKDFNSLLAEVTEQTLHHFFLEIDRLLGNTKVCVRDTTNRPDDVIGSSLLRPRRFSRYLSVELVMWNWRKRKKQAVEIANLSGGS